LVLGSLCFVAKQINHPKKKSNQKAISFLFVQEMLKMRFFQPVPVTHNNAVLNLINDMMEANGRNTGSHPIDQVVAMLQKNASLPENDTTLLLETYRAWEALMASCYQEVLELCATDCRSLVEESQRNWLKYRDVEYDCLDKICSFQVSLSNLQMAGQGKNDLIRSRALQLYEYRNILRNYRGIQPDK